MNQINIPAITSDIEIDPKKIKSGLASDRQLDVALALSELLIHNEEQDPKHYKVAQVLRAMRKAIWSEDAIPNAKLPYKDYENRRLERRSRIGSLITDASGLTPEEKTLLLEDYARLGHLYDMAGHIARENFFLEREATLKKFTDEHPGETPDKSIIVPGGVHEMLFYHDKLKELDAGKVVEKLNEPVSEYVFTQHPTNTNQLNSLQLQRELVEKIEALQKGPQAGNPKALDDLQQAVKKFTNAPLVSNTNFTVFDETNMVINFLTNAYKDLDRMYETVERGIRRKFTGEQYDDALRQALDLKFKFSSWGSAGDKDGNSNIKAENTLEAIILHKMKAAELFLADINNVQISSADLENWRERLDEAHKTYGLLLQEIETKRKGGNDIPLSSADFQRISGAVREASEKLGKSEDFVKAIEAELGGPQANEEANRERLLSLLRKARTFGLNLGKIEYRETAEEYSRVIDYFMERPDAEDRIGDTEKVGSMKGAAFQKVKAWDSEEEAERKQSENASKDLGKERATAMKEILSHPSTREGLIDLAQDFLKNADATDLRSYSVKPEYVVKKQIVDGNEKEDQDKASDTKEKAAIAYHTLRRMELARDFDDMITHNVLAECKGEHNLLEALALQMMVTEGGKRAKMHIVPLFEEAETMEQIDEIITNGLNNHVYLDHVKALQERDKSPSLVQQIQIAHSDNARRAGSIGSRGIIHDGHRSANEAIKRWNDQPAHKNTQVTLEFFEGGSISDSYRNGVRAITAMMKDFGLALFSKLTFQGGDLNNYFNFYTSMKRLLLRGLVQQTEMIADGDANGKFPAVEELVLKSISNLQRGYDTDLYDAKNNPLGALLHAADYRRQQTAGSAGTRGNRSEQDFSAEAIIGVDAKNMRTIAFSEAFQHAGLHPSCLGTEKLLEVLNSGFATNETARKELQGQMGSIQAFDDKLQLTAQGLNQLYKHVSPSFKDAIDKMAYGLVNTRINDFTEKLEGYQRRLKEEKGARDANLDGAYNETLREYANAGWLVYKTLSGEEVSDDDRRRVNGPNNPKFAVDRLCYMIKTLDEMKHLEMHNYKHSYLDGLERLEAMMGDALHPLQATQITGKSPDKAPPTPEEKKALEYAQYLDRIFHNIRDTVYHGRTINNDDPAYSKALMKEWYPERSAARA